MPEPIAVKIENISKQYRLGLVGTGTLSHDLNRWWHIVRGKEDPYLKIGEMNDRAHKGVSDYVWALKNVNMEINQGEVVGIVGRNGAGKSTLLKLISKVTAPTTGKIKIKGRVASLLEVGTGFHPELTGRENVFQNGTILGMTRREIVKKFDEIVDFAGVERYIDTPVKRYSSGMYVRLAFAVAAHLEPDILIVDEVLAVGDAEFQKKCLGKMKDASSENGRTVIFVSHNMAAVKTLCTRAFMFDQGILIEQGGVEHTIHKYLTAGGSLMNHKIFDERTISTSAFELKEIGLKAKGKSFEAPIRTDDEIYLSIRFVKHSANSRIDTTLQFKNESGDFLFVVFSEDLESREGMNEFTCIIPANFFNEGDFYINLLLVEDRSRILWRENDILSFSTQPIEKTTGGWIGKTVGALKPKFEWFQ